jgi:hypothetical protein
MGTRLKMIMIAPGEIIVHMLTLGVVDSAIETMATSNLGTSSKIRSTTAKQSLSLRLSGFSFKLAKGRGHRGYELAG